MENEMEEKFENWRGRETIPDKHGGIRAASIICVVELMEVMVSIAIGNNMGLIVLSFQAHNPNLQPEGDNTPSTLQSTVLSTGVYAIAFGTGGTRPSLLAHGGDQFDSRHQRLISKFFNWYYFSICSGWLMAVTVMAWIKDIFDISVVVLAIALCIFLAGLPFYRLKRPSGSPFTRIANVFVSAARYRNNSVLDVEMMQSLTSTDNNIDHHNKCLDQALLNKNISTTQVEETRTFLGLLPIFLSNIVMNTYASIPLYELLGKSANRTSSFALKRIGLGLTLSSISMAVAAIVEANRKHEAVQNNFIISVFWLLFQYIMLSFSDISTLGGMQEFFYREAPTSMKSMSVALGWCSIAIGFFFSSFLVEITNAVTGKLGHQWLGGEDLNKSKVDMFYVLLCVLNTLNLLNYIFWAKKY
ncbi:hypothetical protein CARUB_v10022376mg [Capsella rubella]|uniref:Major facilitator superfamily (MFS) profile domain-containing protein n=1 Tax=Capsella rubella TaxID=81985 RepID=R0HY42_9BRAS|nr:hypothetical protein CARUB_v10022376mg [Capsella rubella]